MNTSAHSTLIVLLMLGIALMFVGGVVAQPEGREIQPGVPVCDVTLGNTSSDTWYFDANAEDVVTISMVSNEFDGMLMVYDSADNVLGENDDSGGNLNPLIANLMLPYSGRYRIVASSFSSGTTGDYSLSLDNQLSLGQTITSSLSSSEGDTWSFEGTPNEVVTISMVGNEFDGYLELYADGNLIATDDDSGGNLNPLIAGFQLPRANEYMVVARSYASNVLGVEYSLSLGQGNVSSNQLEYGQTINSILGSSDSNRWTFSGRAGDTVTISMVSNEFDSYMELYDQNNNLAAFDDDSGGNRNSLIAYFTLPTTGTYTVAARSYTSSASGQYTLSLIEIPC